MATGELSNGETARLEVRKALIERDCVDCVVQLTGQLFANTQIPCSLWYLSKNRGGGDGYRKRKGEVLFIDGRRLGILIPGSRKQKQLSADDVEQIACLYRSFKRIAQPVAVPGFCRVATLAEIRDYGHVLAPGRYVGNVETEDDDQPLEMRLRHFTDSLAADFKKSSELAAVISAQLQRLTDD
jgi:type I restriction enzyme M protein